MDQMERALPFKSRSENAYRIPNTLGRVQDENIIYSCFDILLLSICSKLLSTINYCHAELVEAFCFHRKKPFDGLRVTWYI